LAYTQGLAAEEKESQTGGLSDLSIPWVRRIMIAGIGLAIAQQSSLSLLSNAVLVWNTLRITEIVNQLRAAGHTIADQDLARVSPLMHTHVIPNGTYRFSDEEEPERMHAAAS